MQGRRVLGLVWKWGWLLGLGLLAGGLGGYRYARGLARSYRAATTRLVTPAAGGGGGEGGWGGRGGGVEGGRGVGVGGEGGGAVGVGLVGGGGGGYLYARALAPSYRAATTLLVTPAAGAGGASYSDLLGAERL